MSTSVELRPGQTLVIKVATPGLAGKPGEASYPFTYEDILGHLQAKKRTSRRSKTPGSKLSRHISLLVNAYRKGVWTTGAPIKRSEILQDLITILDDASDRGVTSITPKALENLNSISENAALQQSIASFVRGLGRQ